jgi:hypothetical protein
LLPPPPLNFTSSGLRLPASETAFPKLQNSFSFSTKSQALKWTDQ